MISASTNLPKASPVILGVAEPLLVQSSFTLGAFKALTSSSDIFLTMSAGVPSGAHMAYQVDTSSSGTPASAAIGTSGKAGERLAAARSEEHTSELQSLMRISYDVFCLKKKKHN